MSIHHTSQEVAHVVFNLKIDRFTFDHTFSLFSGVGYAVGSCQHFNIVLYVYVSSKLIMHPSVHASDLQFMMS